MIGLQDAVTSLCFLLIGFSLVVLIRQLAYPGLPAMGIVAEIIANNTRKLWGYRLMVYSIFALAFLSFIVWAHYMFLTGMGTAISAFFQATTLIISIPSVIVVTSLLLSLYGGSI